MATIMVIIAVVFFLGTIALGFDAFRLEGKLSGKWIAVMCWSLLLCGFAIFMTVLMTN